MRNIIFRGLRVDNGEFIYGFYGWSMGKHYITEVINEMPSLSDPGGCYIENCRTVVGETVSEYTGLKDKNGKDVYEGDILGPGKGEIIYCTKTAMFRVKWHDKLWKETRLRFPEDSEPMLTNKLSLDVVGDVFKNPEMLK